MKRKINKIVFLLSLISLFVSNSLYSNDIENLINLCDTNALECRKLAVEYIKQDDLLDNLDNIETILHLYHKSCNAGDKIACLHLKKLYYDDNIITAKKYTLRELEKVIRKNSFLLGNVFNNLGCLYGDGSLIVDLNYNKAFELFKLVCKNDYGMGCYNLGLMYEQGQAVEKNYNKALELYKKGCKLKNKESCMQLPEA